LYGLEKNSPNFSLAYSYYKAIQDMGLDIQMIPIKREGQGLNSFDIINAYNDIKNSLCSKKCLNN